MSLVHLLLGRDHRTPARRRPRTFKPGLQPILEGLEERTVLSASVGGAAEVAAVAHQQLLTVSNINVTSVQITGQDTLVATLDLTGQLLGRDFTLHNLQANINLTQVGTPTPGVCPILHLELEIEDLNLLGLHVELNNCEEGPIELDITAIPGALLGDLLCSLAGPDGILGDLNLLIGTDAGSNLTSFVGQFLNAALNQGISGGAPTAQQSSDASPDACEILTLELGEINLNLLGLQVTTSDICLFVYAEPEGGLLGDLLCELAGLLDSGANQRAIDALVTQILRTIQRRGL